MNAADRKAVIARNMLIARQMGEIASLFKGESIEAIVLKGCALIHAVPDCFPYRTMEDIDLLVKSSDIARVRSLLTVQGYQPFSEDPAALRHPDKPAMVDLTDTLWYLPPKEQSAVFRDARNFILPGFSENIFHLKPEDFYIHVLAHAAVHHAQRSERWANDLKAVRRRWELNGEEIVRKLKGYGLAGITAVYLEGKDASGGGPAWYRWLLESGHPLKGHLARFLCLPLRQKLVYLVKTLFPSNEFLRCRYDITSRRMLVSYRLLRPLLLLRQIILFFSSSPARP